MWVGADPGGKNSFGVAILGDDGQFSSVCVSCAEEAVELITSKPQGVGVDAPMWWSGGLSADRKADQWLRQQYKISGGTVQAANSLRGAALVQGVMFVELLRQKFTCRNFTEVHPKALLKIPGWDWPNFCRRFSVDTVFGQEHERDARIAAVAAREGFEGRWPLDLALDRLAYEQDPSNYWLAPMHYYWPHAKLDE